ncbi:hypothetical protein Hypma_000728 [Hypsizygus marmoreus]|uniref:Zinc-finger domain-containing protein n=1 Tax=Hypsizygus marmoreus TaxID=39966 RepID=A0A369JA10_HYPMA|nr:hypothetical protein Hypma_000728 [Hypsizygus marmoreus]
MSTAIFPSSPDVEMRSMPPDPLASGPSSDPTSSLRAAALLTLKSKRRKAPVDSPATPALPPRPPPIDPVFQLDYGQEDIPSTPTFPPPATVSPPSPPTAAAAAAAATDSQAREEGEISDEESVQPSPAKPEPRSPTPLPPPAPDSSARRLSRSSPPSQAAQQLKSPHPKPKLSDRISDFTSTPSTASFAHIPASDFMQLDTVSTFEEPFHSVDINHVRPGLALTQSQYDTAKDLVLDLLGWGVPPEYLVDCGLTREMVFYIFHELNLRLPQNLDVTGLAPYTPSVSAIVERQAVALMPPPPPPATRQSLSHPSLPLKPQVQGLTLSPTVAKASTPTDVTSKVVVQADSPRTPISGNLHDMEQQRRQELLARKAAIASRKSKQQASAAAASTSSPPPTSSPHPMTINAGYQDVEMAIPTETVDDFLKSIESTSAPTSGPSSEPPQSSADDMEIDEIPGLGGAQEYHQLPSRPIDTLPLSHGEDNKNSPEPAPSPSPSAQSSHEYPPSSTESTSTTFMQPSAPATPGLPEMQAIQRRGAKRPVAADFVDFETGTRPRSNGSVSYFNGTFHHRRKVGTNFATIGGSMKCVIDLSDSEGEGDRDVVMRDGSHREGLTRRSINASPVPSRPMVTALTSSGGWGTPPLSAGIPTALGGTMSPAALVEKETEIRTLREQIAEKEQRRLQKLTMTKSASSVNTDKSASTSLAVKQEEIGLSLSTDDGASSQRPNQGGLSSRPEEGRSTDSAAATSANVSVSSSPSALTHATPTDNANDNGLPDDANATTMAQNGEQVVTANGRHTQVVQGPVSDSLNTSINGSVDVDSALSSSTQVLPATTTSALRRPAGNQDQSEDSAMSLEDQHDQEFATYDSPFQWYPLLGSRPRPMYTTSFPASSPLSSFPSLSSSSSSIPSFSSLSSFAVPSSSSASSLSISPSATTSDYSVHTTTFALPNLKPLKLATASKLLDPSKRICQYEVPGGGVCRDVGCEDVHLSRIAGHGGSGGVQPSDQDTAEYLVNTLPTTWLAENGISVSKLISALQQVRLKNPQMVLEECVAQALASLESVPQPGPTPT